jgi:hypothetical protein
MYMPLVWRIGRIVFSAEIRFAGGNLRGGGRWERGVR